MTWQHVNPLLRAVFAIAWGTWLWLPFTTIPSSKSFEWIATLSPNDAVWGGVAVGVGIVGLVCLRCPRNWTWLLAIPIAWWTFLAVGLLIANPATPGWITYGFVAATAFAHYMRAIEERLCGRG